MRKGRKVKHAMDGLANEVCPEKDTLPSWLQIKGSTSLAARAGLKSSAKLMILFKLHLKATAGPDYDDITIVPCMTAPAFGAFLTIVKHLIKAQRDDLAAAHMLCLESPCIRVMCDIGTMLQPCNSVYGSRCSCVHAVALNISCWSSSQLFLQAKCEAASAGQRQTFLRLLQLIAASFNAAAKLTLGSNNEANSSGLRQSEASLTLDLQGGSSCFACQVCQV